MFFCFFARKNSALVRSVGLGDCHFCSSEMVDGVGDRHDVEVAVVGLYIETYEKTPLEELVCCYTDVGDVCFAVFTKGYFDLSNWLPNGV